MGNQYSKRKSLKNTDNFPNRLSHNQITQMECYILPRKDEEIDKKEEIFEEIQIEKTRFSDLPLDCITKIADCSNLFDYLNFRAVCQDCRLIVPPLQRTQVLERFKTFHSSPWLLFSINNRAALKFVDPVDGNSFVMNLPQSLKGSKVRYSSNGWLMMADNKNKVSFFNPFTQKVTELPVLDEESNIPFGMAFSSSPTSPDFVVMWCYFFPNPSGDSIIRTVVATKEDVEAEEWEEDDIEIEADLWTNDSNPVFYKGCFYFLGQAGNLSVVKEDIGYGWGFEVLHRPINPCFFFQRSFLTECDGKLMSIFMDHKRKWVKVFSLNFSTMSWERVESLGNYVIYVSKSSSISKEAKTIGTENRIYFPRLYGNSILYYSLKTRRFHIDDQDTEVDFYNTKRPLLACWIDPIYS